MKHSTTIQISTTDAIVVLPWMFVDRGDSGVRAGTEEPKEESWQSAIGRITVEVERLPNESTEDWCARFDSAVATAKEAFPPI